MLSTDANGGRRPSHDAKEAAYQRRIAELEAQVESLAFTIPSVWTLCRPSAGFEKHAMTCTLRSDSALC